MKDFGSASTDWADEDKQSGPGKSRIVTQTPQEQASNVGRKSERPTVAHVEIHAPKLSRDRRRS